MVSGVLLITSVQPVPVRFSVTRLCSLQGKPTLSHSQLTLNPENIQVGRCFNVRVNKIPFLHAAVEKVKSCTKLNVILRHYKRQGNLIEDFKAFDTQPAGIN